MTFDPAYHVRSEVHHGEGVVRVGGAREGAGLPRSQDARLYHEAEPRCHGEAALGADQGAGRGAQGGGGRSHIWRGGGGTYM